MTKIEEEIMRVKKAKNTIGFSVNDCPLWLMNDFTRMARERFNDVYWVTLADLVEKAKAYEAFISLGYVMEKETIKEKEEEDVETVLTMGGLRK